MIGIVLAGGRAIRLGGGDKGDLWIGGKSILERVIAAIRPQCDHLVISANGDAGRFSDVGVPVVADEVAGQPGPLAGVLAGLDYTAAYNSEAPFAITVPTDTPFLPSDLIARLQDQRVADRADIVCARSGGSTHHVVALWSVSLRADLRRSLVDDHIYKVRTFINRHAVAYVTWPCEPCDPFFNVNTPEDHAEAERIARAL